MLRNRTARLITIGLATPCGMFLYEATKQAIHPRLGIWASHFITIALTTFLVVLLSSILLRREERSRHTLSVESKERQRAEANARSEALVRGQIEVQLRKSEERMMMAIEAARIGFFEWDCIQDQQVWSSTAKRLLGLDPKSSANMMVLRNAVHPEDRDGLERVLADASVDRPNFTHEHRALWGDGSVHWIWVKGRAFFDREGRRVKVSGIAMDIDDRKQAEERLRIQAAALQEAGHAVMLTDNRGTIFWVNPAFTQMTGYKPEEVIGENPRILCSGEQEAAFYAALWNTIAAGNVWRGELINRRKDGSLYPEEMTIAPVRSHTGAITHFVAIKQDVTARKMAHRALQTAEERYRSIFENTVLGIRQTTPEGEFMAVNPALARMAGFPSPEEFLKSVRSATPLYVNLKRRDELRDLLKLHTEVRDFEMEVRSRDGRQLTISLNVRAITDPRGKMYHEGTVQDITERKTAEERVRFLAYHDSLTGMPNRTFFEDQLSHALAKGSAGGERVAVLWLDLDDFKLINDSLGHSIGDLLLKQVGKRLQECNSEQNIVARVGGDQFAWILTDAMQVSCAETAADRMRHELMREFVIQDHVLRITCSVGISLFPEHGTDSETLIKNAEIAMYCAKENRRNSVRFFTPDMNVRAVERLNLERRLRGALEKRELSIVYQPLVSIATEEIVGAEGLLRWRDAELGPVSPGEFIPVAENNGVIISIGDWVLNTVCAQIRQWHDLGLPVPSVAVNVSVAQLRHERFLQVIRNALAANGLAPQCLELEITEGVLLSNSKQMLSVLEALARMGLRLSIDDFGTGYSSLSYLKDLPVHKPKIDRSFVRTMTENPRNAEITATIIRMGKALNLKVLAEGVESKEHLSFLQAHCCDEAQGYYYSKPLAVDEFASLLRSKPFASPVRRSPVLATAALYGPKLVASYPTSFSVEPYPDSEPANRL